ncbi:MAG: FG-GAP repeat protein, partial [Phycisphaerales bacterium]|nr:FG-GAP repeat protein [Phycisphaerales bacterium]
MTIRTSIVAAIASLCFTGSGLAQTVADFIWEQQKLTASDAAAEDYFGDSVAISGDTALMGAYGDDDNGTDSGSAYIYQWQADGSSNSSKLTASDGAAYDDFGKSVAISGDTALVGAPFNTENGFGSGSVYIYQRQAGGSWSEIQKLTASDGVANNLFGYSVAISGDTALVGSHGDDDNGSGSGSAYIYQRQADGSWSQSAKLTASDAAASDYFGYSVAISGEIALVGVGYDDDNGYNSGSAYIYQRQADGSWSQSAKLTASDGAAEDYFGDSVAISGEIALVGAYEDDDNGGGSGSAYVYQRQADGSWSQSAKLTASDGAEEDYFGYSVAISGEIALVGAFEDDDNGTDSGSAYIYGIYNVINLDDDNTGYASLDAAVQDAATGERLAVRSSAFDYAGIINASDKALQFIAIEPIAMGTDLMFLPGDGSSFIDSDDVAEAGYSLAGSLIAPDSGQLVFSNLELDTGGELVQNNSSLFVYGNMNNHAGTGYLAGNIFADQGDVSTDAGGVNRISRDTDIYADYVNDGTTAVHRGTLYIYGDLSGEGTMLGDVDTGPGLRGGDLPSPGDGFSIGGSSILGVDASLRMLDFDWTLGIGGDVDWAINANDRFAMNGATLELTGLNTGLQSLELMSLDVGP